MSNVKVGLIGVGLNTYWAQFGGLKDKLDGYRLEIKHKMENQGGVSVIDAGLVDDEYKAVDAASLMRSEQVCMLFVFISTYALSSTIMPVVRNLNIPVILLNLQPAPAIDYAKLNSLKDRGDMTGEWLANCQACSVPEFTCVFNRAGVKYDIVTGYLDDAAAWADITGWISAVKAARLMNGNRLGVMGNYYGGMIDVYSDLALHSAVFGTHIEVVEMCQLVALRDSVTEDEVSGKIAEFHDKFNVDPECGPEEMDRAARTSVALDKLVRNHNLGSLAYFYKGMGGNGHENVITSIIPGNTLLTGRGIPVAGEYEVKNVQAMKILSLLGAGGSFSEFYAVDFNDDVILFGHDGPANPLLAEDGVGLVPLPVYHGKPGKGLSIQMSVRHGPVTLLSVVENNDGISLLVAEGESVPGPVLRIGNVNSRYKFPVGCREFVDRWCKAGPSHHCAIGAGHVRKILEKFAMIVGIPVKIVC